MGNSYILVVLGIIMAKGLGFYRDMVFAGAFGTSIAADIYFQVFGLVNLIFTGIGVALSTLVIKNMNKAENRGFEKAYAARFLQKSALYLILAACVMALLAKPIVHSILPALSPANFELAVRLFYIMLPSLVFLVVAYIISGILQNEKVYFITAIMSLPFNVAIILSLFVPNVSIETVGLVTTFGWFLHIVILLPSFYKKGYSLKGRSAARGGYSGKNTEILWIFISNMMFQLCFYVDRAFVGTSAGMAATFNYASNLFITISSVFVVAMSTVIFPSISKNYEEGHIAYVNALLQNSIKIMVSIFLPFLLVIGCFGEDVIRLLYERGSFTEEATRAVATVFLIYGLGILGYLSQELFNKILYLAEKYKYSVLGTVAVVALNAVTNVILRATLPDVPFGNTGLSLVAFWTAASSAIYLTAYAVLIAIGIRRVVGAYWTKPLLLTILKTFLAGGAALLVYAVWQMAAPRFTHGYITFLVPLASSGVVYILGLLVTGVLKELLVKKEER